MEKLNFPPLKVQIKQEGNDTMVFDIIRKKYLKLTPEEWVRQNTVHFFVHYLKYPQSLISIEKALEYNGLPKRFDICVYKEIRPWLLVECKAPYVKITQSVMEQIASYNYSLKAPYLFVTNGKEHFCYKIDMISGTVTNLVSLPKFDYK